MTASLSPVKMLIRGATFEKKLNAYFSSGKSKQSGLPSVSYFVEQCHLSANYFRDLIKKEPGKTAQDHIQLKPISLAREYITDPDKSVSQIACELGFSYPQHFSRMFKEQGGSTPS